MQFGICGGPDVATLAREAGYDYWEWSVPGLLHPLEGDAVFAGAWKAARDSGLPCPVLNQFLPGSHKVTGPAVDMTLLRGYVTVAFARAREAGVSCIVFGSGGARQVPEGFDHVEARGQIVAFLRMAGPIAAENGVTVAVEPLNPKECNILTTVAEGASVVRETNHRAIRLLADSYHVLRSDNVPADIEVNGVRLAHIHVATKDNRLMPGVEPCDLAPFFHALARAGYDGRLSFEGKIPGPGVPPLAEGLAVLKQLVREGLLHAG
jgi:sugar phosphate isomerase/epimerase